MKKLIFFFILCILFIPRVNAQLISGDVILNNVNISTTNWITIPANSWVAMRITAQNTEPTGYFRVQACFDDRATQYNISPSSLFKNPLVVKTNVPCNYYNSLYTGGRVVNFYFNYDVTSSGGGSFTATFNMLTGGGSFQLLSLSSSDVPYDVTDGLNYSETDVNIDFDTSVIEGKQDITNNKLNDIDDTLNDSSVDNSDSTINNLKNKLPTNTVISDLLLLPVSMLNKIVQAINGTCSNFSLGTLYGSNLVMPCINIQNYVGSTIWTFIDLVFSGMFVLVIRKKFIQIFENITNLKEGGNEVD